MNQIIYVIILFLVSSCVNQHIDSDYKKYDKAGIYGSFNELPSSDIQNEILVTARQAFSSIDKEKLKASGVHALVINSKISGTNVADGISAQVLSFDKNYSHVITYIVTHLFKDVIDIVIMDNREMVESKLSSRSRIKDIYDREDISVEKKNVLLKEVESCFWLINSIVGKEETVYLNAKGFSPFAGKSGINIGIDQNTGAEVRQFSIYTFVENCVGNPIVVPEKTLVNVVKATNNKSKYFFSNQLGMFWRDIQSASGSLNNGKDFAVTIMIIKMFSRIFDISYEDIVNEAKDRLVVKKMQSILNQINIAPVTFQGKDYWNIDITGELDGVTKAYIDKFIEMQALDVHKNNLQVILQRLQDYMDKAPQGSKKLFNVESS